jgi:hypothetical protein
MENLSKYTDEELKKLAFAVENMLLFGLQNKWNLSKKQLKVMEKEIAEERESRKLETYEVGVEVKENPSKSDKITWVEYKVKAKSEFEAREKASDLCGEEFGNNPYSTEII